MGIRDRFFTFAMSTIGSGYDLSAMTFSPDGRVFQVEYAMKAVDSGHTCIGIKARNGVVLAVEKKSTTSLLIPGTQRRIFHVDLHAGMVRNESQHLDCHRARS